MKTEPDESGCGCVVIIVVIMVITWWEVSRFVSSERQQDLLIVFVLSFFMIFLLDVIGHLLNKRLDDSDSEKPKQNRRDKRKYMK